MNNNTDISIEYDIETIKTKLKQAKFQIETSYTLEIKFNNGRKHMGSESDKWIQLTLQMKQPYRKPLTLTVLMSKYNELT